MDMYARLNGRDVIPCGDECPHDAWEGDRHVGNDMVGDQHVSTVFLVLNHAHEDGPGLWFETMVFDGPDDGWIDRYSTYDEAEAGHKRVVELLRAGKRLSET